MLAWVATFARGSEQTASYTYSIATHIGGGGTAVSTDGWTGDDIGNWVVGTKDGNPYLRNNNDGDDDIGRVNDGGWAFSIPNGAYGLVVECGARLVTGTRMEVGLASGVDDDTGAKSLFRFGVVSSSYFIRHWDGSGNTTYTSAGSYSGDTWKLFRLEVNLLANNGNGSAVLYVNGTPVVTVANMHLLDTKAPLLHTLNTLQVRTISRYVGPGDITVTTQHYVPASLGGVSTHIYDLGGRVASGAQVSTDGWAGDDLANWIRSDYYTISYFRNANDGNNAIGRVNDGGWAFDLPRHFERLLMITDARWANGPFELGIGADVETGSGFSQALFRFGTGGSTGLIRSWDGSGNNTAQTGGSYPGDAARNFRFDLDRTAGTGNGAASLYFERAATPIVTVGNMHLLDASAPQVQDLDTLQVFSSSRYNGPGSIWLVTVAPPRSPLDLVWAGDGAGNTWDTAATPLQWRDGGTPTYFADLDNVTFDATGSANSPVNITEVVSPGAVVVDADADYTFTGSGNISGTTALTKSGNGTVTLTAIHTYTGGTTVNGGTLELNNNASWSDCPVRGTLTVNSGGTVKLTGRNWVGFGDGGAGSVSTLNVAGGTVN